MSFDEHSGGVATPEPPVALTRVMALLDHAHDAVIVRRADGAVLYWNRGAEETYGWTRSDAVGQISHALLRTGFPKPLVVIEQTLQEQGQWSGRLVHTRKDGARVTVESRWALDSADSGGTVLEINRDLTPRLEAQEAARERERQLRFITDSAPVAIAHCDRESRFKFVNRPYAARFGLEPIQLIGRRIVDVLGARAFEIVRPYVDRVLSGERVEVELEVPYETLGPQHTRFAYQPELDDAGRVVGYVAAVVNVSDRRRAEQAERLSRERFELVVNSTGVGVWYCDLPLEALVWNATCKEHFGVPADAPVTIETFYERLHPDDREPTRSAIERAIAERTPYDVEYRTQQPGGSLKWIRAIGRVAVDASGRPVRFDGVTVDVTSQKRAEQQLRQREAYFRSAADSAPALIWVTDPDGRCTYVSRRWIEYTGIAAEEALGLGWMQTVHPDDLPTAGPAFLEAIGRRQPFSLDYRIRRADGTYRWAEDAGIPRYNEHGEYEGFIGCLYDVHDRQMFAEALREVDRRKDAFLATLAHELRNPLAAMRNAVQLIARSDGEPQMAQRAGAILDRQLRQLSRLVDDLLDVSRITRDQLQLRRARVALADVVRTAVESTALISGSGSQHLSVTLPVEPVFLDADAERLSQVFINLLSNAIKYTPPGGTIALTAQVERDAVVVVVSDTGPGIPPDKLEQVFGMFVQVEQGRDRAYGGLGIGLTLVKSLVELHGGTVAAESDGLGRGSRFVVRLPCVAAGPAPHPPSVPADLEGGMQRVVLIADDNMDAAESLQLWLQMAGHEVHTAADGARALSLAESLRPEIVLLDLGMPGLSGYDVARRIREAPWGREMVLIALTGWGQDEDRRQTTLAGFDHHLTKPVPPDDIEELIRKV